MPHIVEAFRDFKHPPRQMISLSYNLAVLKIPVKLPVAASPLRSVVASHTFHPSSKLHRNSSTTFWVIILYTDKQTNAKHNLLLWS